MADIEVTVNDKQLRELGKLLDKQKKTISTINLELSKEAKSAKDVDEAMRRSIQVQKEVNKNHLETTRILKGENDVLIRSRIERQKATAQKKKELIANNAVIGSYNAINAALNKNISTYKNLSEGQRKNEQIGGKLLKTIQKQDAALKGLDAQMGRHQRNVGNYTSSLMSVSKALLGAFGVIGGVQLFARVLTDAFNTVKEFQKANAELAGVLGKTRKEITFLTEDAERLGASTAFTAEEVTRLQIEYAKLGRTEDEIVKLTEATINLSIATGRTAAEAAAFVGATLNQFNLTANDTVRVVDAAAKSFSSSALDFEKLSVSMAIAGPIAAQFGQSLESTIAQLGILADRGLDASTSGTSLRNIFLELSQKGLTLEEGLSQIRNSSNQLTTAFDLFGKRGATAAVILANNSTAADNLTESLNNSAGAADKLAKEQLNTLDGSLKLLRSAWSGLILDIENGNGILGGTINAIIKFVTWIINAEKATLDFVQRLSTKYTILRFLKKETEGVAENTEAFATALRKTESETKNANRVLTSLYDNLSDINDLGEELEIIDAPLIVKKLEGINKIVNESLPIFKKAEKEKTKSADEQITERLGKWESSNDLSLKGYRQFQKDLTAIAKIEEVKRQALQQASFDFGASAGNAFFQIRSDQIGSETTRLIDAKNQELAAAGEDADKRAEIEAKYAKKESELRIKSTKNDKLQGLFNVAIKTAEGVINYLSNPITAPLVPFVIATGAAQAAAIAARPIPQYDKGKTNTPDTFIAGEKRPEFVRYRNGQVELLTQPTLFTQSRGMDVISSAETERMLSGKKDMPFVFDDSRIVGELKNQNSRPILKTEYTPDYVTSSYRKGNILHKRLKKI